VPTVCPPSINGSATLHERREPSLEPFNLLHLYSCTFQCVRDFDKATVSESKGERAKETARQKKEAFQLSVHLQS
jgi:hypothetical protein